MNDLTRGTQLTRLRSDGHTIHTVFALSITPSIIEQAASQACGFLSSLGHVWYMDFSRTTALSDGMNNVFRQQFRAFREAGGKTVVALIPDSLRGCKILRTALASSGLNNGIKIDLFDSEESAKSYIRSIYNS